MRLRDVGDPLCDLPPRQPVERRAADADLAALRRQQPEQRFEQRALAGAVRPEKAEHVAGTDHQVDAVPDRLARIAEGERPRFQLHAGLLMSSRAGRGRAAR